MTASDCPSRARARRSHHPAISTKDRCRRSGPLPPRMTWSSTAPAGMPDHSRCTGAIEELGDRFPHRAGNAWLALRLNQASRYFPPPPPLSRHSARRDRCARAAKLAPRAAMPTMAQGASSLLSTRQAFPSTPQPWGERLSGFLSRRTGGGGEEKVDDGQAQRPASLTQAKARPTGGGSPRTRSVLVPRPSGAKRHQRASSSCPATGVKIQDEIKTAKRGTGPRTPRAVCVASRRALVTHEPCEEDDASLG